MRLRATPLNRQHHGQAADDDEEHPHLRRREGGQDNNEKKSMIGFETEYIRRKYFIVRPHYKVEIRFSISDIILMVLMILSTLILINVRLSSSIGSQSTTSTTDTAIIGLDKSLRGFLQRSLTTNNNNGRIQQLHSNKRIDDNNYYDPTKCKHMINGHCDDANVGGAWMYRDSNGNCLYTENNDGTNNAPQSYNAVTKLRTIFPNVTSVADYGGGPGTYLVGFLRNNNKIGSEALSPSRPIRLVTIEPYPLNECLFSNILQDTTDWINTPLSQLPNEQYDLVMTIEVLEHIPSVYHEHIIRALSQATTTYLLFSAAQPGQVGQGHIPSSMKTRSQWINDIEHWSNNHLLMDHELTNRFHIGLGELMQRNSIIFRKVRERI